jgi:phage shock protein A
MGVFKRLRDITLASVNDLIDKAEDPVKLTDQYIRDMSEDIQDAEQAVAKQIAIGKRFKQQLDEAEEMVGKRGEQALKAMEQGNEDLARRALEDKKEHQSNVDQLKPQYDIASSNAEKLKEQLTEMKDQFLKMKSKRDMLAARHEAAKAQKNINKAMSSFNADGAAAGMDRMTEKVLQMEAEAQAGTELRDSSKGLDNELDALSKTSGVDDEFAALKAQVAAKKAE